MPDNVLWYIVFSFPFFFPGYSVIESTVACVLGLLSWATGEVLSQQPDLRQQGAACIFFLMAILLSGIQCRGLLCFIQISWITRIN